MFIDTGECVFLCHVVLICDGHTSINSAYERLSQKKRYFLQA